MTRVDRNHKTALAAHGPFNRYSGCLANRNRKERSSTAVECDAGHLVPRPFDRFLKIEPGFAIQRHVGRIGSATAAAIAVWRNPRAMVSRQDLAVCVEQVNRHRRDRIAVTRWKRPCCLHMRRMAYMDAA